MSKLDDQTAEVFITSDPVELQVAQGVLEEAGIGAAVRDLHMSAYPLAVGLLAEWRLVVSVWDEEEARRLLLDAVSDGALKSGVPSADL